MEKKLGLITSYEAARELGVHPKTVSRLLRQGKLTGVKLANRWLIEQPTLEMFSKRYVGKKGRRKGWSRERRHRESSTIRKGIN